MADSKISALTELTAPAADDELIIVDKSDTSMAGSGTDKRIVYGTFAAAVGSITTIQPGATAAAGTALTFARGDHRHAIAADVPLGFTQLTQNNGEGTSTSFARADHAHALPGYAHGNFVPKPICSVPASGTSGVSNTWYAATLGIIGAPTITGIRYRVGSSSTGNVRSALYDAAGAQVAARTSNVTQATANTFQNVAFDSTYVAIPGFYYMLISFFNSAATWWGARISGPTTTGTNATTVPSSISTVAQTTFEDADRPIFTPY